MLLNRHNLSIAELASKEESRYTLAGIKVSPKETVVTDGHVAVRVTTVQTDVEKFPQLENFIAVNEFEPFVLHKDAAREIERALPKNKVLPILQHAVIGSQSDTNGNAYIGLTDLDTPRVYQPRKMAGSFPDIDKVTPEAGTEMFRTTLNVDLFIRILKQMSDFLKLEQLPAATLRFYGEGQVVRVDARNSDTEQEMTALIMPVKPGKQSTEQAQIEAAALMARLQVLREENEFSEPEWAITDLDELPDDDRMVIAIANGAGAARVELRRDPVDDSAAYQILDVLGFATERAAREFVRKAVEGTMYITENLADAKAVSLKGSEIAVYRLDDGRSIQAVSEGHGKAIVRLLGESDLIIDGKAYEVEADAREFVERVRARTLEVGTTLDDLTEVAVVVEEPAIEDAADENNEAEFAGFIDNGEYDHVHPGPDCREVSEGVWDCSGVNDESETETE